MKSYTIRLTDSITLKKFVILKPEVEAEFHEDDPIDCALIETQDLLDRTVAYQLGVIADRMTKQDAKEVLADASADPRFVKKVKARFQIGN